MVKGVGHFDHTMRRGFTDREDEQYIPDLVFLQKESFSSFICLDNNDDKRRESSKLQEVFKAFFPIHDNNKNAILEFVKYRVGETRYTAKECLDSGRTYCIPLYASLRLIVLDKDEEDSNKTEIRAIKDQEVFLCDVPLMTDSGSFIINGVERVVVSQMRRAPGVFFDSEDAKLFNGKNYTAKIIPLSGSWIDFEFDSKDILYFRIDKKRKLPVSSFFKILKMSTSDVLKYFYKDAKLILKQNDWVSKFNYDGIIGKNFEYDIVDAKTAEIVIPKNRKITKRLVSQLKDKGFEEFIVNKEYVSSYVLVNDVIDNTTGEVLYPTGTTLDEDKLNLLKTMHINEVEIVNPENSEIGPYIFNTIVSDRNTTTESSFIDLYKSIKIGEEPSSFESAEKFINNMLFSNKYNLSEVGRMKANYRLGIDVPLDVVHLTKEDILSTVKILSKIKHNDEKTDDIDNLMNRRLRASGELIEAQFRSGMARLEKGIIDKLNITDPETVMPQNLINSKPLITALSDFFATSQLSQFMDQTNPLSEIGHKRRISALGPGGLTRDRAGFEVRDVHPTHYGRLCPLESPDGANIGLINSLALYARINKYGFIETPYRKVNNGVVSNDIVYLSAIEESGFVVAQSNIRIDENGKILDDLIACRKDGETLMLAPDNVNFIDISPKQLISVATNLVPFIENNDSKRSTMGANMMKQAVPVIKTEVPLVGTGMEKIVAMNSTSALRSKVAGVVKYVDSQKIVMQYNDPKKKAIPQVCTYKLNKNIRTNSDTIINQYPIVDEGQEISANQIIANSQSITDGELALGRNALIAFSTWDGYNYEDAVLISERLVREDAFTSIHLEEFEIDARDTRIGPEEITRDIPNVSEEALKKLDETGIIYIGAHVKAGDILVGKTTPKSEAPMTPEEKLLKVIFGEKSMDVKDSSLYVPPSVVSGTVVDVKVYTRNGLDKDQRAVYIDTCKIEELARDKNREISLLRKSLRETLKPILLNEELDKNLTKKAKKGVILDEETIDDIPDSLFHKVQVVNPDKIETIEKIEKEFRDVVNKIEKKFETDSVKVKEGDELPQGTLKKIKIIIATKQKLQAGDKMSARHGNKGVISRVLPVEDMPYMDDGTPIDILLSPLGIPSRMNIGQVLETHLGWASVELGKQIAGLLDSIDSKKALHIREKLLRIYTRNKEQEYIKSLSDEMLIEFAEKLRKGVPFATGAFDCIKIDELESIMEEAGIPKSGQIKLIDGRTGEYFDRPSTVGYMYMLKLNHLVDNKIHARSIGPYSLITQQPLGGKSHFGGQRFGEMECWALQAYGAAHTLQEMLTVKSDDVVGRVRIYESIIQGNQNFTCGLPESFNVMVKEVRSLGLNLELMKE